MGASASERANEFGNIDDDIPSEYVGSADQNCRIFDGITKFIQNKNYLFHNPHIDHIKNTRQDTDYYRKKVVDTQQSNYLLTF